MQANEENATVLSPYKEQEPFLERDKRYYGFVSGVGAGKTAAGILRTARNMEEWNPGEMGAIVAPTRQMVVDVIVEEMETLGLMDYWEYKSSYSEESGIHSPNGSRALVLSADNQKTIERLKGLNLAWFWMDEEAEIDPRAREILMQRLRVGNYRNGYITTTPKGYNHTHSFFVGDQETESHSYGEGTIYESRDRKSIVGVPSWANPHTPEDYHESMESLPDEIRAQEVEGNFVEIGSGVFTKSMITFVTPSEIPENRQFSYLVGVDVGVEADSTKARDKDTDYWAAALLMVNNFDKEAYLIDIHRKRGMSLTEGVNWIRGIVSDSLPRNVPIYVESNQSQRWLKQELKDNGLNAIAIQNMTNKEERLVQMSIPFENGTVKVVNREIDQSLGYDPRWREWIQELLSFPEGSHDDMVDATQIAIDNADIGHSTKSILGANPHGSNE